MATREGDHDRREVRLTLYLTSEQAAMLARLAKRSERSMTATVRHWLNSLQDNGQETVGVADRP
jgi:hypothetical protein